MHSCEANKIVWANLAAARYFGKSAEELCRYSFQRLSGEQTSFIYLNTLIQDEVEVGLSCERTRIARMH